MVETSSFSLTEPDEVERENGGIADVPGGLVPFLDTIEHVLDAKFRAVLPVGVRAHYVEGGVLTLWAGPCLAVFTPTGFLDWRTFVSGQLAQSGFEDPGAHIRYVNARSSNFRPDVQGRFIVPDRLRSAAGIDRNVAIVGAGTRVELWNSATYHTEVDLAEMEQNIAFLQATYDIPRP